MRLRQKRSVRTDGRKLADLLGSDEGFRARVLKDPRSALTRWELGPAEIEELANELASGGDEIESRVALAKLMEWIAEIEDERREPYSAPLVARRPLIPKRGRTTFVVIAFLMIAAAAICAGVVVLVG